MWIEGAEFLLDLLTFLVKTMRCHYVRSCWARHSGAFEWIIYAPNLVCLLVSSCTVHKGAFVSLISSHFISFDLISSEISALWSDQVRLGCDQTRRTFFRWKWGQMKWDEMRWGDMTWHEITWLIYMLLYTDMHGFGSVNQWVQFGPTFIPKMHAVNEALASVIVSYIALDCSGHCTASTRSGRVHLPPRGLAMQPSPKLLWTMLFIICKKLSVFCNQMGKIIA